MTDTIKKSGYEAVYEALNRSPEAEAALNGIRRWLTEVRVVGWTLVAYGSKDVEKGVEIEAEWEVAPGPFGSESDRYRIGHRTELDLHLVRDDVAKGIVDAELRRRGTLPRGCTYDGVLWYGPRRRQNARPYKTALEEHVNTVLSALKRDAEARIKAEVARISQTEEYVTDHRRALASSAKDSLRRAVLAHRQLPTELLAEITEEVLREAEVAGVMKA